MPKSIIDEINEDISDSELEHILENTRECVNCESGLIQTFQSKSEGLIIKERSVCPQCGIVHNIKSNLLN